MSVLFVNCFNCSFDSILITDSRLISSDSAIMAGMLVSNCTGNSTLNNVTSLANSIPGCKSSLGGIVGEMIGGTISNSVSKDNVFDITSAKETFLGGITGKSDSVSYSFCESINNQIFLNLNRAGTFSSYGGGISANSNNDKFEYCKSTNNTVKVTSLEYNSYSGGLVANLMAGGSVQNCVSNNNTLITRIAPTNLDVTASSGGLIAITSSATLFNCSVEFNTITSYSNNTSSYSFFFLCFLLKEIINFLALVELLDFKIPIIT